MPLNLFYRVIHATTTCCQACPAAITAWEQLLHFRHFPMEMPHGISVVSPVLANCICDTPRTMLDRTYVFLNEGTDGHLHESCRALYLLTCYLHTCLADEEEEDYMYEGLTDDDEDVWADMVAAEEERYAMRPGAPYHPGVPF